MIKCRCPMFFYILYSEIKNIKEKELTSGAFGLLSIDYIRHIYVIE